MQQKHLILLGFFLQLTYVSNLWADPTAAKRRDIDLDHIEEQTLFFKVTQKTNTDTQPPVPRKTSLFDLKFLGKLRPPQGEPFFLLVGSPCQNCIDDKSIYALRPTGIESFTFVYPGKILDPKTKAVVHQSRMFFGQCTDTPGDVLMTFQSEKVDRHSQMQTSVFIAQAQNDTLDERLVMAHLPKLQNTLRLVKKKVCTEIEGRNRLMTTKPIIPEEEEENTDESE